MAQEKSYFLPNLTFDLKVKVGKLDFSSDIVEFSILTSVGLPYQTFIMKIFMDNNDVIIEKIYGQTPIYVTVNLLGTEPYPLETTEFELMYLSSDINLPLDETTNEDKSAQKQRNIVTIQAVARQAYKTMNTYVNDVYQGVPVKTAIDDLVNTVGATVKYDTNGQNTEKIDQILIPPDTLYKNILYLNNQFGLFNGMPTVYCTYDNTVYIKNLTNKMNQAQALTIYQFSMDQAINDIIKKCNDGIHYYTRRSISSKYEGNSVFAYLAPKLSYIVKPRDRFYHQIDIDLESFAKQYGLISKNDKIFFDKNVIKTDVRKTIHNVHTGYELSQSFINGNVSKNISKITDMRIIVEQSIKILNLMSVGEPVEITTYDTTKSQVSGKYILNSSEIKFNKIKDWEASATLGLMRTNRALS